MTATITVIDRVTVNRINEEHALCEQASRNALAHAIECGRLLAEVKGQLRHGEFGPWLEEHFEASARTAQTYMQLAAAPEQDAQRVAGLSLRQARDQIAKPRVERVGRDERRALLASQDFGDIAVTATGPVAAERQLPAVAGAAEGRKVRRARDLWCEIGARLDELERDGLSHAAKHEEATAAGVLARRMLATLDDLAGAYER